METLVFIIAVVVVVLFGVVAVVCIIVLGRREERKRNEGMSAAAREIGFTFSPKDNASFLSRLGGLHLFYQGDSSRRITNVLHGETKDIEVAILDYVYTESGQERQVNYYQTVICFWSARLDLTYFSLRPEDVFHKIGSMFGFQDIDLPLYPTFSKQYLLQGPDAGAVRATLTDPVAALYENTPGLSTEGAGNCLIYYRSGKRIEPKEIVGFMEEGFRVFELFASQGSHRA